MGSYTRHFLKELGYSPSVIQGYYERLERLRRRIHPTLTLSKSSEFYLRSNKGVKIFYQVWTPNDSNFIKRIFICQHGHNVHGDLFYPFADQFVKDSLIIAIDNRGHGRSGPSHGDYDDYRASLTAIEFFVQKYHQFYPSLPVFLMGESLGSALILHYLHKSLLGRKLVKGMILMVAPVKVPMIEPIRKNKLLYGFLLSVLSFLDFLSFHRVIIKWPEDYDNPTYLEEFNDFDIQDMLKITRLSIRNVLNLVKVLVPLQNIVKTIEVPVLILQGTGDKVLDPLGAKMLYNSVKSPQKKVVLFKNANHSLFMDKNSQHMYEIVDEWTKRFISKS